LQNSQELVGTELDDLTRHLTVRRDASRCNSSVYYHIYKARGLQVSDVVKLLIVQLLYVHVRFESFIHVNDGDGKLMAKRRSRLSISLARAKDSRVVVWTRLTLRSRGDFRQIMLSSLRKSLEFSRSFFQTATKKYSLIEFRGIGMDGMAGILILIKILYQIS